MALRACRAQPALDQRARQRSKSFGDPRRLVLEQPRAVVDEKLLAAQQGTERIILLLDADPDR